MAPKETTAEWIAQLVQAAEDCGCGVRAVEWDRLSLIHLDTGTEVEMRSLSGRLDADKLRMILRADHD